jgi:hypothetical protein
MRANRWLVASESDWNVRPIFSLNAGRCVSGLKWRSRCCAAIVGPKWILRKRLLFAHTELLEAECSGPFQTVIVASEVRENRATVIVIQNGVLDAGTARPQGRIGLVPEDAPSCFRRNI